MVCQAGRMDGRDWGRGDELGASLSSCPPLARATATSSGCSRQITGNSSRGGTRETVGPPWNNSSDWIQPRPKFLYEISIEWPRSSTKPFYSSVFQPSIFTCHWAYNPYGAATNCNVAKPRQQWLTPWPTLATLVDASKRRSLG